MSICPFENFDCKKRQRLGFPSLTRAAASLAALQRQPSSGTFSGWRDEEVNKSRTKTLLEEDDENDLKGFVFTQ